MRYHCKSIGHALDALAWACNAKVVNGRSEDILAPRDNITRAEIAQIFVNYKNNIK